MEDANGMMGRKNGLARGLWNGGDYFFRARLVDGGKTYREKNPADTDMPTSCS